MLIDAWQVKRKGKTDNKIILKKKMQNNCGAFQPHKHGWQSVKTPPLHPLVPFPKSPDTLTVKTRDILNAKLSYIICIVTLFLVACLPD